MSKIKQLSKFNILEYPAPNAYGGAEHINSYDGMRVYGRELKIMKKINELCDVVNAITKEERKEG